MLSVIRFRFSEFFFSFCYFRDFFWEVGKWRGLGGVKGCIKLYSIVIFRISGENFLGLVR